MSLCQKKYGVHNFFAYTGIAVAAVGIIVSLVAANQFPIKSLNSSVSPSFDYVVAILGILLSLIIGVALIGVGKIIENTNSTNNLLRFLLTNGAKPIHLKSGRYLVGSDIPSNKYKISGAGKFLKVAPRSGNAIKKSVVSDDGCIESFSDNDILQLEGNVYLTPTY